MCMKMHCYVLLLIKHGASQLYWGGGLHLTSAGVVRYFDTRVRSTGAGGVGGVGLYDIVFD